MTSQEYFNQLNILFLAFCAGVVIFLAVLFYIQNTGEPMEDEGIASIFLIVVPMIALSSGGASFFLYKKQLENAQTFEDLKQKMALFRTAFIMRIALLEGPALFGGVAYFLTNNMTFLAVAAVMLVLMFLARPTPSLIIKDLNLSDAEQMKLEDPDAIIANSSAS